MSDFDYSGVFGLHPLHRYYIFGPNDYQYAFPYQRSSLMDPVLRALLDQFKDVKIDVPGLLKDPETLPTVLKVVELLLRHIQK